MLRGRAELLQDSTKRPEPVTEVVVEAPAAVWDVDDSSFDPKVLRNLQRYYQANAETSDAHRGVTLDCVLSKPISRAPTAVKVIDLVFVTTSGQAGAGNLATKPV